MLGFQVPTPDRSACNRKSRAGLGPTAGLVLAALLVAVPGLAEAQSGPAAPGAQSGAAPRATSASPPPECRRSFRTVGALDACFQAAQPGSRAFISAGIELGGNWAMRGNLDEAARHYDLVSPPGGPTFLQGDVYYHALRASTYYRLDRAADGFADARYAYELLTGRRRPPGVRSGRFSREEAGEILALILPSLYLAGDPVFNEALVRFKEMEIPRHDAVAFSNRSAALGEVGELAAAVEDGRRAVAADPNWAPAHGNLCNALMDIGSVAEAVEHCQRAVSLLPQLASLHFNLALALAANGQCTDAEAAMLRARELRPDQPKYREPLSCTPLANA